MPSFSSSRNTQIHIWKCKQVSPGTSSWMINCSVNFFGEFVCQSAADRFRNMLYQGSYTFKMSKIRFQVIRGRQRPIRICVSGFANRLPEMQDEQCHIGWLVPCMLDKPSYWAREIRTQVKWPHIEQFVHWIGFFRVLMSPHLKHVMPG